MAVLRRNHRLRGSAPFLIPVANNGPLTCQPGMTIYALLPTTEVTAATGCQQPTDYICKINRRAKSDANSSSGEVLEEWVKS